MVVALHHDQHVGRNILARHVPRFARSADAQALALAQGVIHEPLVFAHRPALGRAHRAGLTRQIALEKFAERPFADKADAGAVLLGGIGQSDAARQLAHARLGQLAQGKQHGRQLGLAEAVEKIALILVGIQAAQ